MYCLVSCNRALRRLLIGGRQRGDLSHYLLHVCDAMLKQIESVGFHLSHGTFQRRWVTLFLCCVRLGGGFGERVEQEEVRSGR